MTIALDPGMHGMRSLRRHGDRLVARRCRTIAAFVDDNDARRRWLNTAHISHLVAETCLVIPGDAAVEAQGLCEALPVDLLPGGDLPADDPVARQVIAVLVDGLLPRSLNRGAVCCFAQPGCDAGQADDDTLRSQRLDFFAQVIRLRGYAPLPINPATALVLAELESSGFTGIGLALGASGSDLAVVHRGNPIACARLAHGGRWLDEQIARRHKIICRDADGVEILHLDEARQQKESVSLGDATNLVGQTTIDLYRGIVGELVEALAEVLASFPQIALLPHPLPIVVSGGPSMIDGFIDVLRTALDRCDSPVELGALQRIAEPEYTIARGCLIRAAIEEAALRQDEHSAGGSREKHAPVA